MSVQRLVLILVIVLGLVGLGVIVRSFLAQLACEGQLINHPYYFSSPEEGQEIREERIFGQSFVAPRPNLTRIDLMFHTYNRHNTHEVTLRLLEVPAHINNPLEGLELFRTSFNAGNVRENTWQTFTFPPISDSAGKTYLIALQSPHSTPGDAISAGGITRDLYPAGSAFFGSAPVLEADMAFRTCYAMSYSDRLQVFSTQLTDHRPALWALKTFYLLSVLVYVALLIGLFWKLIPYCSSENPDN